MEQKQKLKEYQPQDMKFHKPRISIEYKVTDTLKKHFHHASVVQTNQYCSRKQMISMTRKNKSQELKIFESIKKQEIFNIVYEFIGKMITNSEYTTQIIKQMEFAQNSQEKILNCKQRNSNQSSCSSCSSYPTNSKQNMSEKQILKQISDIKINIKSPSIVEFSSDQYLKASGQSNQQANMFIIQKINAPIKRRNNVSILLDSLGIDGSKSQFGSVCSSWLSMVSQMKLEDIELPNLILTKSLVARIYEDPEPFLINLSLCLIIKFLYYTKIKINCENCCWILSIGTIIAYKIYYDEPVSGLIESFAEILETSEKSVKELQRYFLQKIQFLAVITNQQYQLILSKIISL